MDMEMAPLELWALIAFNGPTKRADWWCVNNVGIDIIPPKHLHLMFEYIYIIKHLSGVIERGKLRWLSERDGAEGIKY